MGLQILALVNLICLSSARLVSFAFVGPQFACDPSNPTTKTHLFCETTLPISRRAEYLVSRLTLDEKVSQLVETASAIPRLGIPAYQWWSEALHGISKHGKGVQFSGPILSATSFPQVILTASTFDANLWFRIGQVSHYSLELTQVCIHIKTVN
ncbi:putative beta-D-xylosidase 7 [Sarracenia purpurea var. burkii]